MDATFDQLARQNGLPSYSQGSVRHRGDLPRQRGGQPGNRNALKHGFYSKTFGPTEDRDIDEIEQISLDSEIDMLRVSIRRIFDLTASVANPIEAVRYVHVLTRAVTSLDHLVVRQHALHNTRTDLDEGLREALDNLNDKGGVRAADLRKRYLIQKAIVEARLDRYVPPPPGAPPPPDPLSLPQPDPAYSWIDPFSRHYSLHNTRIEFENAYGEESQLAVIPARFPIPGYTRHDGDGLGEYGLLPASDDDEEDDEDEEVEDDGDSDEGLTPAQIDNLLARQWQNE